MTTEEQVWETVDKLRRENFSLLQLIDAKDQEIERLQASLLDVCEKSAAEVQRLKGLIDGLLENSMPEPDCIDYKRKNNL